MKSNKFAKVIAVMLMALILVVSCFSVSAKSNAPSVKPLDFGNHNDYGSDFGGSDWGGSDWGGSDWDDDDDYYYYGGTSGGGSSGGPMSFSDLAFIGGTIVVILAVAFLFAKMRKPTTPTQTVNPGSYQGRNILVADRTAQIESIIKEKDPNFSANDFITFAKEVFVDIQEGWSARDLSKIRIVMHDNLYKQTQKQVEEKLRNGTINRIENIAVNTAYLTAYKRDKQFEYATIYLNARFFDYEIDEKTGNILRGNTTTRWDMRYLMKFMRSTSVKTKDETNVLKSHNCPNCGAPLEMQSSGHCEYCGSEVTSGLYSWVLCDLTTVRDDTIDEGISVDNPNQGYPQQ